MFKGKIAVATNDQVRVAGHIGKCRSFLVFEINGENITSKELRENVFTNHRMMHHDHNYHDEGRAHSHTHLVEGLKDCKHLISRGGGWRVVEDLKQNNILTLFTDIDLIEDAVKLFIKGELKNELGLVCNYDKH